MVILSIIMLPFYHVKPPRQKKMSHICNDVIGVAMASSTPMCGTRYNVELQLNSAINIC